jgi:hypothetical protein
MLELIDSTRPIQAVIAVFIIAIVVFVLTLINVKGRVDHPWLYASVNATLWLFSFGLTWVLIAWFTSWLWHDSAWRISIAVAMGAVLEPTIGQLIWLLGRAKLFGDR